MKHKSIGLTQRETISIARGLKSAKIEATVKRVNVWGLPRYKAIDMGVQPFEWVIVVRRKLSNRK